MEQSVIIFLLGLQFSALAAACVCEWVRSGACAWVNVCGCDTSVLVFFFFGVCVCVKIFFYRFSRVNHCLLYEYFNELYTV